MFVLFTLSVRRVPDNKHHDVQIKVKNNTSGKIPDLVPTNQAWSNCMIYGHMTSFVYYKGKFVSVHDIK